MSNKRKLCWLLFLGSLTAPTTWGANPSSVEVLVTDDGNQEFTLCEKRVDENDPCLNYRCGSYSLASPLDPFVRCAIESAATKLDLIESETEQTLRSLQSENSVDGEESGGANPPFFLFASVSCAFDRNRVNFVDYVRAQNKTLDAENLLECVEGDRNNFLNDSKDNTGANVTTNHTLPSSEILERGLKRDEAGTSVTIPKNIQIRIYAIDDNLEFRYRSSPCNIIAPIFGIYKRINFGRWTFNNAPGLEFVWNYTAITETRKGITFWERLACEDIDLADATLELWIPNRILEKTTILGPKYDYTLVVDVNSDIVDSGNLTSANIGPNATTNETEQSIRLLTEGPPKKVTVWNDGIGTRVIVSIVNGTNSTNHDMSTDLQFLDRSLNGVVETITDSNVKGLIQLNGSVTRASMHQVDDEAIADTTIEAIGFRQVLSVSGQYNNITIDDRSIDGTSIDLFTTGDCSSGHIHYGKEVECTTVDSNFTGNGTMTNGLRPLSPLAKLPRSCFIPTEVFDYYCNPLSSGAVFAGDIVSILPHMVVTGSVVVWVVVELFV